MKTFKEYLSNDIITAYHGSSSPDIKEFKTAHTANSYGSEPDELGIFFTSEKYYAKEFGDYVYTCKFKFDHPLILDGDKIGVGEQPTPWNPELDTTGYDGIIINKYTDGTTIDDKYYVSDFDYDTYVVFNPNTIKIVGVDEDF